MTQDINEAAPQQPPTFHALQTAATFENYEASMLEQTKILNRLRMMEKMLRVNRMLQADANGADPQSEE